jgi:hypothetical protein
VDLKSKGNWLEVEDDMRLKISVIQPDISWLVSSQKIHNFLIKLFKSENLMQQEIRHFVRLVHCKILNKIFALDLCSMLICKQVYTCWRVKGSSSV